MMKTRLLIIPFFFFAFATVAQEVKESQPEYPGGREALVKYIREELEYPKAAIKQKIEGRVIIAFVVDETGGVTDVKVVLGIGGGCDEEAVRVIENIPEKFSPGYQMGKPVRAKMMIPIQFAR